MNERLGTAILKSAVWTAFLTCFLTCSMVWAMQGEGEGEDKPTNESWTRLSETGFDVQQLDGLRRRNSQPLTGEDRQPMDELLTAVNQWDQNRFESIRPLGLLDLLADTGESVCRRVQLIGKVRQCLRIKADLDSVEEDAHPGDTFQLTIFPDLDGQKITVKSPEGNRVPYGRFAVTVRTSRLPKGETEQSLLEKRVQIDGFHYRFWRYDSVFSGQQGLKGQIGALVIGGPIKVLKKPSVASLDMVIMWIVGVLALGLIALGWYGRAKTGSDRTYDALPDMLPEDWKVD
ncbi:hypothetical protein N9L06_04180 [Mariniblastus sp.]|nr:hypothetical protein [Mariniblastus sp.]